MIIGISGKIGNGKDAVGQIIQKLTMNSYQKSPWKIKKFAYKLKQIVSILTGIPVEDLEKQEVKDRVLGKEWNQEVSNWKINDGKLLLVSEIDQLTVRKMLQLIGTEAMRNSVHPNTWVNALMSEYFRPSEKVARYCYETEKRGLAGYEEVWGDLPKWIITDVRFPNEAAAIKERGGIIVRVSRGVVSENEHPSETALDDYQFDTVIVNNGTLTDLEEMVRIFLKQRNLL